MHPQVSTEQIYQRISTEIGIGDAENLQQGFVHNWGQSLSSSEQDVSAHTADEAFDMFPKSAPALSL